MKGKDRPVANVRIAGQVEGRMYGYGQTNASGEFTLTGVPRGLSSDL